LNGGRTLMDVHGHQSFEMGFRWSEVQILSARP
jgi:hypothetical protein